MVRALLIASCLVVGCKAQAGGESSAQEGVPSPMVYGELREPDGGLTPLSEITADPAHYEGRVVLTEGEVQRVCKKRGCWLELADSSGARAFIPMAGHSFTVPMDSVGETALVEGTVHRRERSEAERQHLESDGAGSSIPAVSIEATGVLIR